MFKIKTKLGHWCKNCRFAHLYNTDMIGLTNNISTNPKDIVYYTEEEIKYFRKINLIPDSIPLKMYIGTEELNFVSRLTIEPEDCECFPNLEELKNIFSKEKIFQVKQKVDEWLKLKNKIRDEIEIK